MTRAMVEEIGKTGRRMIESKAGMVGLSVKFCNPDNDIDIAVLWDFCSSEQEPLFVAEEWEDLNIFIRAYSAGVQTTRKLVRGY